MNILPLVSSLLLVFSVTTYTFLHERIATHWEQKCYESYMRTERGARSASEKALFEQKKRLMKSKDKGAAKSSFSIRKSPRREGFQSHRERKNLSSEAKLNLAPLLGGSVDAPTPLLYEVAARLMRKLYAHVPFYQGKEGLEYQILDLLIKNAKANPNFSCLEDLFSREKGTEDAFYKILKGTRNYSLSTLQGYPPLSDYFTINKAQKPAVYFLVASKPLLIALFGDTVAQQIIEKEKEKWIQREKSRFVTKGELEQFLLRTQGGPVQTTDLQGCINFSIKKIRSTTLLVQDTSTGVCAKKKLREESI